MGTVESRNNKVKDILNKLYEHAEDSNYKVDESSYNESLDILFTTTAWGFREIVLVVIVGMKLNSSYRASTALYECNPRAIYEGPIKEFLLERKIPHRKSGPLNVAKAAVGLNDMWAAQRRPALVAEKTVQIINYLENGSAGEDRINRVGVSLMRRLISSAKNLEEYAIELDPAEDPNHLYYLCHELITKTPDSGNTPQKIAALLLKCYHDFFHTGIIVTGGDDRASVTSTTSKKPGDINEEIANKIYKVYEVTVKRFDMARIRDSFDCISTYNENHQTEITEVVVICRHEDCPNEMTDSGLKGYLGHYSYQNVIYYFWDIYEWIANTLQRMTAEGRIAVYLLLNSYVNEINTSVAVKRLWQQLHQEQENG